MDNYFEVNGIRVWQFDKIEGKMNRIIARGCIDLFAEWLQDNCESIEDPLASDGLGVILVELYCNASEIITNGNRVRFYKHYAFSGNYEFSAVLYHKNDIAYAEVCDKTTKQTVGYVEIYC